MNFLHSQTRPSRPQSHPHRSLPLPPPPPPPPPVPVPMFACPYGLRPSVPNYLPPQCFLCQSHQHTTLYSPTHKSYIQIRRVGRQNFIHELSNIHYLVNNTPFNTVSIDTEYPGVIHTSPAIKNRNPNAQYSLLKANVDQLQLIQVGFALSDSQGNLATLPPHDDLIVVWEFAISDFDLHTQPYNQESINMLTSRRLDFEFHRTQGIHSHLFARALIIINLFVSSQPIHWVTFHGAYDFGYLIKALTRKKLPDTLAEFMKLVQLYFGKNVYDIKHMTHFDHRLFGGLERLATNIGVERIFGQGHQAGSDSLLQQMVFQKIKDEYLTDEEMLNKNVRGRIYPLTRF